MYYRSILSLSCWPRFLGVEAFSFKRNLSAPDSTGKQYPTQVSETTVNKEEKENKITDTELNVTIQRLVEEVNELQQKLDAVVSEKEKVKEMSWWDLHKVDVYAVMFGLVVVGWLVYRWRKK